MRPLIAALALLLVPAVAAQSADPAPALAVVTGTVTDADTGMPVVGAGVVLADLGIGAVSQRDGSFRIEGVPAGTHAVRTGAYRYHLATLAATVDGPTTLDVVLAPGAGVGCAVVHEHGEDGSHMERPDDSEGGS
ncbi:carboxypeptidase regulatory-like domain-containing protein [Rubrivirga sp. IMCC45206]|uniref:carboxypeptidase regulatory-like domain-containing protein n=1 Tax=Rubrivirga sp. IMCC45206 TaxID=3391614 RepID=UPI00399014DD